MAVLIKTLSLTLDDGTATPQSVECQLDEATLADNPSTEDVVTFCGTDSSSTSKYELTLGGFQDWGTVNAVTDLLHNAYISDPVGEIDFVLTVGSATRTGVCKPTADIPFGGQAGSPLKFSVTLAVPERPTDGVVTPPPLAADASKGSKSKSEPALV